MLKDNYNASIFSVKLNWVKSDDEKQKRQIICRAEGCKTLQVLAGEAGAAFEEVQSAIQAAPEVGMHAMA